MRFNREYSSRTSSMAKGVRTWRRKVTQDLCFLQLKFWSQRDYHVQSKHPFHLNILHLLDTVCIIEMVKQMKNPLNLWTDFPISKHILSALNENGLEKPLPIQIRSLKATLIDNKHVFGAAQTGSGKTLAYAIPVVNRILENKCQPCSIIKQRLMKSQRKKEDFELIDGAMMSIEDMIVDKVSNDADASESGPECTDDEESVKSIDLNLTSCPEAIVLVPTRELAFQVRDEINKICAHTDVKTCCIIGGLSQDKQLRTLRKLRPEIVIATPGRLYDIVQSDSVDHLNVQSVASIRTLVIDEADRMVQKGHFEEMLKLIDILKESKQFRRTDDFQFRVYLFSATLTFLHELPERFKLDAIGMKESRVTKKKEKSNRLVDPKEHTKKNKIKTMLNLLGIERAETRVIDINDETSFGRPSSEQLMEFKINCLSQEKDLYLYYFLVQNPGKRTLVFYNSKDCLRRLSNIFKYLKFNTLTLHADLDQKKRLSSLEKFRSRVDSILIATDVAARGLDVKDLDCVIHYQVPKTCESYIHRSGRTARLNNRGLSLTLCEPQEALYYKRLCKNINRGKDLNDYEIDIRLKQIMKNRVALAQLCDQIEHQLREAEAEKNWFVKAAKDCDIELDDEDIRQLSGRGKSQQQNVEEVAQKRRRLARLQKQLDNELRKPLITKESLIKQSVV